MDMSILSYQVTVTLLAAPAAVSTVCKAYLYSFAVDINFRQSNGYPRIKHYISSNIFHVFDESSYHSFDKKQQSSNALLKLRRYYGPHNREMRLYVTNVLLIAEVYVKLTNYILETS
eukprot:67842_1